jgi:predicted amino acid dehydrogenase
VLRELARELSGESLAARKQVLDAAAQAGVDLAQRFALLTMHADDVALGALCERLRVPQECADLALLAEADQHERTGRQNMSRQVFGDCRHQRCGCEHEGKVHLHGQHKQVSVC